MLLKAVRKTKLESFGGERMKMEISAMICAIRIEAIEAFMGSLVRPSAIFLYP